MRPLRVIGFLVATALLAYAGALATIPSHRHGAVLVTKDGEPAYGHCIRLGGRVYQDNLCLLGGR